MPRTIYLTADFEASLDRMVESGRYGTADDVVMFALAALEDREAVEDARVQRLQAMLDEGLEDIRAGRTVPAEEVFEELREIIARAEAKREAAE